MKSGEIIRKAIQPYQPNELIFSSALYKKELSQTISEAAFYKSLERMCKSGELMKISKGTYHKPKQTKYGVVPPNEKEIVSAFIENGFGMEIGYTLYNRLKLTTQIGKNVNLLSSALEGFTKTIRNIQIEKVELHFTEEIKSMVEGLEVFKNYYEIQDLNPSAFLKYSEKFAKAFNNDAFDEVINKIKYPKSTIAFTSEVLEFYNVNNNLNRHLSMLSNYKHPKMEEIYETARTENGI